MSPALPVALSAALLFACGNLFQKAGLDRSAESSPRGILAWARALLKNPKWTAGILCSCAGAALQYVAMANWSLSVVQPLIGLNPVVTALLCRKFLGERAGALLWPALLCALGGVAAMGFAEAGDSGAPNAALWPFAGVAAAAMALLASASKRGAKIGAEAGLALASGVGFGLSAILFKAAWTAFASAPEGLSGLAALCSSPAPWAYAAVYAAAFFASQAALLAGRGMFVVPLSAAVGNLLPVLGGVLVVGESFGREKAVAVALLTASLLLFAPRGKNRV